MAKKLTIKDLNYQAYEMGIEQGRATIIAHFSGKNYQDDPLDLLEAMWPNRTLEEFETMIMEDGTVEDVVQIASDFMDGIEDGVKSALGRWLVKYKRSYD